MSGDRPYTDVRVAKGAGMPCAVVLTGETPPGALAAEPPENKPAYVPDGADRLLPPRVWEEFGRAGLHSRGPHVCDEDCDPLDRYFDPLDRYFRAP